VERSAFVYSTEFERFHLKCFHYENRDQVDTKIKNDVKLLIEMF